MDLLGSVIDLATQNAGGIINLWGTVQSQQTAVDIANAQALSDKAKADAMIAQANASRSLNPSTTGGMTNILMMCAIGFGIYKLAGAK